MHQGRLGPGDANTANPNPRADVNQIPAQLIDRIEVVTAGASATYGNVTGYFTYRSADPVSSTATPRIRCSATVRITPSTPA